MKNKKRLFRLAERVGDAPQPQHEISVRVYVTDNEIMKGIKGRLMAKQEKNVSFAEAFHEVLNTYQQREVMHRVQNFEQE